jgi:hypothetical protein
MGWGDVSIKKYLIYPVLVLKTTGTQKVGSNPKTMGNLNSVFCTCIPQNVSFKVITAVVLRMQVCWDVMLCHQASSP